MIFAVSRYAAVGARRCTPIFEAYRAKLSAKRGKVKTQDDAVRALPEVAGSLIN